MRRIVVVHARRTPIVVAQHVTSSERHGLLTLRLRTKRPHSHGLNEYITHLRFDPKEDPRNDFNAKSTCPYPGVCVRPRIDTRLKGKDSLTAKAAAHVAKQEIWDGMKIA